MKSANRLRHTFRLPPELSSQLAEYAGRKRVSQARIVESALASFLSPDASERLEAALSRRLDRLTRQVDKLDYHIDVSNEALALFVRLWLNANPPLPEQAQDAAQADGQRRYKSFIETLTRRMEFGPRLTKELQNDIPGVEK